MQWYGTGGNYGGWAVQGTFTAVPISSAPPPPPLFTHEDSAIAQATDNVTVITVTLTKPVNAGDLLVCAAKSPDGSMTSANLSDYGREHLDGRGRRELTSISPTAWHPTPHQAASP